MKFRAATPFAKILTKSYLWLLSFDRMKKYQIANMKNKDQRMKAMNEVLEGIKVGQKERQCWKYHGAENSAA